ncbi:hypothetical protein OTU49_009952, partial [Cherax quadricarinatus]
QLIPFPKASTSGEAGTWSSLLYINCDNHLLVSGAGSEDKRLNTMERLCLLVRVMVVVMVVMVWAPTTHTMNVEEFVKQREMLLAQEQTAILGQDQVLTLEEQVVNERIMTAKMKEMNEGFETLDFLPSKNFLLAKKEIEASEVFKIIREIPKGAALHLHDTALASAGWVVEEITYWPDLYLCYTPENQLLFK